MVWYIRCPANYNHALGFSILLQRKVMLSWRLLMFKMTIVWKEMVLEFSFKSMGLFIWSRLFCTQYLPCSVRFQCILEGGEEVWTRSILCQFIEGQTHLGVWKGAKMGLALYEPKWVVLYSISKTTYKHPLQAEIYLLQNNQWDIIGD